MIDNEQDRVTVIDATGDGQLGEDTWGPGTGKTLYPAETIDGERGSRDGVAAHVVKHSSSYRDARGRLLPGNPLSSVAGIAAHRDRAVVEAIKAEFQPARVVSMLNRAWDAAESRNSPRAMKDITELILSYLIGKPTQYNVSTKMDGNMLLTLLRDARTPGIEDTGDNEGE